jgi:3-methyl-2-oxobutanoate hydroxymethyltransferase
MGHVGLTPQSVHVMGGYRVQGKKLDQARALVDDAVALDKAGVFAIVLEGVPESAGRAITEAVSVPTLGIGAGRFCDGQVLVFHDLVGLGAGTPPKFVRRYARIGEAIAAAVSSFISDVRDGSFPSEAEIYTTPAALEARRTGRT